MHKVEALSALKRLQELLQEGAEPFAKRVMQEISNADIAEKGSSHDDAHAATPLLREIQEGAELIRVEVRQTSVFRYTLSRRLCMKVEGPLSTLKMEFFEHVLIGTGLRRLGCRTLDECPSSRTSRGPNR